MHLTLKNGGVYVVHGGKIMDLGAIGQLRKIHVVDKKGPRKSSQSQSDQGALDKSSSEADVFFEWMEKGCKTGRTGWVEGLIGKALELDCDAMQDMMRSLRTSIQVSMGTDPEPALEGFKRLLHKRKQAMTTQQEEAARETERRRRQEEMVREKERQKQNMAEKEMERQAARSETKVGFGRYKGRTCESIYKEDRSYCEWIRRQDSTNAALIEFREFIQTIEREWENEFGERKRRELEETRRAAESKTATLASGNRRHAGRNGRRSSI